MELALALLLSAATATPIADQGSVLPAPTLFEPGVISSGANDGAPTFSPDGRTLFFERTNSRWTMILTSKRDRRGWNEPKIAPFSGVYGDQQPAYAPDGSYLIYVSSRKAPTGSVSHLYRVDRIGAKWSASRELPTSVNFSRRVFKPSVAANGDLYYMADVGSGGAPQWRLFVSVREGGGYRPAQPLPFSSAMDGDVDPWIDPAGRFIIFSSNTRSALADGHEHLFVSDRTTGGWSPVRAIRYVGDDLGADDGEAQVSPDGKMLYFTSSRVLPAPPSPRRRADAAAALRRMNLWDNSNGNVWTLRLR